MVQELSPRFSLGTAIGQGLGQGLQNLGNMYAQQQMRRGEQQYQRNLQQRGLDQAELAAMDRNASPLQQMIALYRGTAGLDMDRSNAAIAPLLFAQNKVDRSYGPGAGFGQQVVGQNQSGMSPNAQNPILVDEVENRIESPLGKTSTDLNKVSPLGGQQYGFSGVLPKERDQQEMVDESKRLAIANMDPMLEGHFLDQLIKQNQIAQEKRAQAMSFAKKSGISDEDLPDFMQIGQKHSTLKDLPTWLKETQRDFSQLKELQDQIKTAFVPGIGTGAFYGAKSRDDALKNLLPTSQQIVKLGKEDWLRKHLAGEKLSQTEIEGQIFPLSRDMKDSMKELRHPNFPGNTEGVYQKEKAKGSKRFEKQNENAANWLKNNLTDDESLLQVRDRWISDRKIDWRQFADILALAEQMGLKLNAHQKNERTEIDTQPPRRSLGNIFYDWDRPAQYLRQNK